MVERQQPKPKTEQRKLFEGKPEKAERFVEFVQANSRRLKNYGIRLSGDFHLAEDYMQEAFLGVAKAYDRDVFDLDDPRAQGYLRTVARNAWIADLQKQKGTKEKPKPQVLSTDVYPDANAPIQESHEESVVLTTAVREAVGSLTTYQREFVEVAYFLDMPIKDIAEKMHLTQGAVRSYTRFLRAKLREKLADRGITKEDIE